MRHYVGSTVLLALMSCDLHPGTETAATPPIDAQLLTVGTEFEVCDGECKPIATDIFRSFVVTDPEILKRFPLRRVLDQLVANSGTANTADDLWKQWWSSQRVRAGGDPPQHPFCDDNAATINGFPITCPRDESLLEFERIETHAPVGLFNRFDLAPMDGSHCGEYRIVYALGADDQAAALQAASASPEVVSGRNFIIFEGVMPNPNPECELAGCLPVAEFWQSLTTENDVNARGDLLEQFYFDGICDFEPVVLPQHYGLDCRDGGGYGGACGQIRTNQFIEREWNLREFTLRNDFTAPGGELLVQQTTVAVNPHVSLWDSTDPNHASFSADFIANMNRLMPVPDGVNVIGMGTSPKFDAGESVSQFGGFNFNDYDADLVFEATINGALLPLPSTVTEFDIEERATTQGCGGCHELSNFDLLGHTTGLPDVLWPPSLRFVHIDEASNLSPALLTEFLPHRQQVMTDFLTLTCGDDCFPASGLKLAKVIEESDPRTGEPVVRFELLTPEEFEKIAHTQLPFDTLSGSLVH
jgi:hypothetical protein